MGTTPTGLPYPEPTDPVAGGAAAIRALAEALEPRTAYRTEVEQVTVTLDAAGRAVVIFKTYFPAGRLPLVIAAACNLDIPAVPWVVSGCAVLNNTGFMVEGIRLDTTPPGPLAGQVTIMYAATGPRI